MLNISFGKHKFTNARYVQVVLTLSDISNFDIMVRKNGQISKYKVFS